jgi:hypothetical protein
MPPLLFNTLRPNLEHLIKSRVIDDWVLVDCNLVAGIESIVDITSCPIDYVNMGMIINVGYQATAGKEITSVLSVGYGYNAMAGGQPGIASALTEPLQTSDARVQLVGPNIIYVEGYIGVWLTNLRCVLANDADFNNVPARAMTSLSDLCTLAAKAFIYKECTVKLSNGVVIRGVDMGKLQGIVDGYADSNTMYREYLTTKWYKVNMLNDRVSMNRHIRRIIPS